MRSKQVKHLLQEYWSTSQGLTVFCGIYRNVIRNAHAQQHHVHVEQRAPSFRKGVCLNMQQQKNTCVCTYARKETNLLHVRVSQTVGYVRKCYVMRMKCCFSSASDFNGRGFIFRPWPGVWKPEGFVLQFHLGTALPDPKPDKAKRKRTADLVFFALGLSTMRSSFFRICTASCLPEPALAKIVDADLLISLCKLRRLWKASSHSRLLCFSHLY